MGPLSLCLCSVFLFQRLVNLRLNDWWAYLRLQFAVNCSASAKVSVAEKIISRVWISGAPYHCKLSLSAVAGDWCWAASCSWWTSLTARMRVSMLCRVAPSNGWKVYQWELLRSEMEKKFEKYFFLFNIKRYLCTLLSTNSRESNIFPSIRWINFNRVNIQYVSVISDTFRHWVSLMLEDGVWPLRVHKLFRLQKKQVWPILYRLRAVGE